ncbi:YciI family protein [Streptosporangium sp. G11]|uniref:YciI family protein n=1 Tax=Streptosporangium sp. G11 TaxID=3436926 RepID=UPI003EBE82FF
MKQYLLSVYQPDGGSPGPEVLEPIAWNLETLEQEMKTAGVWVFSGGLHSPDTATVVRVKDGDTLMTDGPYAEGKEHLGGFTVIRAPDLDAALEWGRRLALAIGLLPIEVRPFQGEAGG